MSDPYEYSKITENRNAVVFDYRDLKSDEKKLVENLARMPGVYQFSLKSSTHINELIGFLGGGGLCLGLVVVLGGQIIIDPSIRIILTVVAFVISLAFVHGIYLFWRALKTPLSSHITITPMYAIVTDGYEIKYWGLWALTDFLQTHLYVNNIYSTTEIDVLFPHDSVQFALRGESQVMPMIAAAKTWKAACEEAIQGKSWDHFRERDILKGLSSAKRKTPRSEEEDDPVPIKEFFKQFSFLQLAIYAVAAVLISLAAVSLSISFDASLKESREKERQQKQQRR